ncbi:MAG TPA: hypothetical protein VHO69_03125 [Phototrophicaceae bacterium]|nr:hypothetical protein [Phototrophicaceae bacterium]
MPANVDGMVREGISAYRAGKKEEARTFLLKAVEIDEHNEQAWLWLSAVVDSPDEQQICLENVLAINPNNERARQGLQFLQKKSGPPAPPSAKAEDVLANASFAPSPPAPPKTAPPPSPFSTQIDDEELPSSIEWDAPDTPTATSSASSRRKVNEPSSADYDDWVSGLNLGGKSSSSLLDEMEDEDNFAPPVKANLDEVEKFISASVFDEEDGDDLFGTDAGVRMPEDLFNGPFSTTEPTVAPTSRREEKPKDTPATSRRQEKAPPPAKAPVQSRLTAPAKPDPLLDEVEAEEEDDEFFTDTEFDGGNYDQATLDAPDPTEMFGHIPQEIKATRLPGTNEGYPILVLLGFLVVLGLNAGAVALLVMRLTGKL